MTKIDIISGFLGAGKTTLIKKLLADAYASEQIVLIENEFGEIGIDGGFLEEAGIEIREMNSGCICCSLVGDFEEALKKVITEYHPDRIVIEPSGVGKLSDVITAIEKASHACDLQIEARTTVADANKCMMYMKNFGEFFNNQIEHATAILLSRTQNMNEAKLTKIVEKIKEHNPNAAIITTPWDELSGKDIIDVMHGADWLIDFVEEQKHHHDHECDCGHHHEHHHHNHECDCGHHHEHHHHDHECDCGCHHEHHHHDHECDCGCHHEHHHHDHECDCGHHHEHHYHDHECDCGHHHHAEEVFTSIGGETVHVFSKNELENVLHELAHHETYGTILRAKGMLKGENEWFYFDLVPEEVEIRIGKPCYTGRFVVIGSNLDEEALKKCFYAA